MKIALCFTGHIRDVNINYEYWQNLLKDHEVSVFGSFWDDYQNESIGDTFENFEKLYKPKKYEVENYKSFKESTLSVASKRVSVPSYSFHSYFMSYAGNFINLSLWYKVWRCNMLSKIESDFDIVIRTRTDVYLDNDFQIEKSYSLKLPVGFYHMNRDNYPNYPEYSQAVNDCFAYGPPDIMDYYCFLYLNVMHYFEQGYSLLGTDHFLKLHLSQARIKIDMFPNYMILTRRWRNEPDDVHNRSVNPLFRKVYWSDDEVVPLDPIITSFKNPNKISFE